MENKLRRKLILLEQIESCWNGGWQGTQSSLVIYHLVIPRYLSGGKLVVGLISGIESSKVRKRRANY
jgi:hypothetical protein